MQPGASTDTDDDLDVVENLRARAAARYSLRAKPARIGLAAFIDIVFGPLLPFGLMAAWTTLMVIDVAIGVVVVRRILRRIEQADGDRTWYRYLAYGWGVSAIIQGLLPVIALRSDVDGADRVLLMSVCLVVAAMVIVAAQGFAWLSLVGAGPILLGGAAGVLPVTDAPRALALMACYAGYLAYLNSTIRQSATRLAEQTVRAERLNTELGCERDLLVASRASLEIANERLSHAATHDALTGLANRSLLADAISSALVPARRDVELAVLFGDLDRFKAVNDERGHAVGDELLRQVADRLRSLVRPGDVVARVGGDEFVVLMAGCPLAAATAVANRIEHEIERPFDLVDGPASVGITVGISMARAGDELDAVIELADAAMYERKRRNGSAIDVHDRGVASA